MRGTHNRATALDPVEQLFWSQRGEIACARHAPASGDSRWLSEAWKPVERARRLPPYQCQHCHGSPLRHPSGSPCRVAATPAAVRIFTRQQHHSGFVPRERTAQTFEDPMSEREDLRRQGKLSTCSYWTCSPKWGRSCGTDGSFSAMRVVSGECRHRAVLPTNDPSAWRYASASNRCTPTARHCARSSKSFERPSPLWNG